MRIDIPFHTFKSMINVNNSYGYKISDKHEVYFFINKNKWYLSGYRLIQCLYGPCQYDNGEYFFSVPWVGAFISIEEWLEEIDLEIKRIS